MAIEKMVMMNVVANLEDLDQVLRNIVLLETVHIINAIEEIDDSNFTLTMMEDNVEEIVNMCMIKPYKSERNFKNVKEKISILSDIIGVEKSIDKSYFKGKYSFDQVIVNIDEIYEQFKHLNDMKDKYNLELDSLKKMKIFELLENVAVNLKELWFANNFKIFIGTLSKENQVKLSKNYENVSAAVMHLGSFNGEEAILVVTPKDLSLETDRILRSVYFNEIEIIEKYLNYPKEAISLIGKKIKKIEYDLSKIDSESKSYKEVYGEEIRRCYNQVVMEEIISSLKSNIATTRRFFYLSGWVAEGDIECTKNSIETVGNVIIDLKNINEVGTKIIPPTKLKNNKLVKPFETLVQMYGTPSYGEIDPTSFLAISYMILFGAMFGDFGQGIILMISGFILAKKIKVKSYGELLVRLGCSSSIFGFFYDSFFGYEEVISLYLGKLLNRPNIKDVFFLRPIENINTILSSAIVLGIIFLVISFGFSIFNKLKINDYKEGIFGRNGIAGLVLYITLLMLVAGTMGVIKIHSGIMITLSIICVIFIVIREPLSNRIKNKKPLYNESPSEYYVESGFDILETFLSMLSNSVSFIRVGAFALNHVGLFIAFHTMADIIGNMGGQILMLILGNIIVIFLEGLIVFIQGLRLVYYEMFSKYYTGEGQPFKPMFIE